MLVVDASTVLTACSRSDGFDLFGQEELVAPPLMWSEFSSSLHESVYRGEVTKDAAARARATLESRSVTERRHPRLHEAAWELSSSLGWAKTHDAEYVALAQLLDCRLVTADLRLRRGTDRLGFVITPAELDTYGS